MEQNSDSVTIVPIVPIAPIEDPLTMAPSEEMRRLLTKECFYYNYVKDLNKCIHVLRTLTTNFALEDETRFFVEPAELLQMLTLVFYKISTRFDDEMNPIEDIESESSRPTLIKKYQSTL